MSNWVQAAGPLSGQQRIWCSAIYNNILYFGTGNNGLLFRLNETGDAFEQVCAQLNSQTNILALAVYNGRLYGGTIPGGRLFRLNEAGDAWEQVCSQIGTETEIRSLMVYEGRLYGGSFNGGRLLRLNIAQDGWEQVCAQHLGETAAESLVIFKDRLYCTTYTEGMLFRLNEAGNAWEQVCAKYNNCDLVGHSIVFENQLYATCHDEDILLRLNDGENGWEEIASIPGGENVYSLGVYGGRLFVGTSGSGELWILNKAKTAIEQVCTSIGVAVYIHSLIEYNDIYYGTTESSSSIGRLFRLSNLLLANFLADELNPTVNTNVNFTNLTINSYPGSPTWLWGFGDLQASLDENPIHSYGEPGVYTVSLKATNSPEEDTETKIDYIRVAPQLIINPIDHFGAIIARLPTGRAWRGRVQRAILKVIADKIKDITDELIVISKIKFLLFGEEIDEQVRLNDELYTLFSSFAMLGPQTVLTGKLTIWEFILDLLGVGTVEDRINAIISALINGGKISLIALETALQDSGFDVYVHRNTSTELVSGGKVTLSDTTNLKGLIGGSGLEVRLVSETGIIDPDIVDTELCVNFIDSDKDESKYRTKLSSDPRRWEYTFFIGGETKMDRANVELSRKAAFRELILKTKPMAMWAVLLIDYV